jgi:AraC family transcriptional regulator
MTVRIENLPPMRVAYVHHHGPYHEIGDAFAILMEWAMLAGVDVSDEQVLAVSDNRPGSPGSERERYDAAVTVKDDVEGTAVVGIETVGGGDYVVVEHVGPYDTLNEAYQRAGENAASEGWTEGPGPALEFFENDPESAASEDLRTWVWVPVVKAAG